MSAPTSRPGRQPGWRVRRALLPAIAVWIAVATAAAPAHAEPWDLSVHRWPLSLRMRALYWPAADDVPNAANPAGADPASAGASGDDTNRPQPAPTPQATPRAARGEAADSLTPVTPLSERLVFRFNLGFGLDGGQPTSTTGDNLTQERYEELRIYGFGDAVLGARGLTSADISFYAASRFRIEPAIDGVGAGAGLTASRTTAVPSVYDNRDVDPVLVHSAYVDVDQLFDNRWLAPLALRAGRQYRYGPMIAHFDGLTATYRTRSLSLELFFGDGADPYGQIETSDDNLATALAGQRVRLDLSHRTRLPVVLTADALRYGEQNYFRATAAARWRRDLSTLAGLQTHQARLARAFLHLRARLSQVTRGVVELHHRTGDDVLYDVLAYDGAQTLYTGDATEARRYLNLERPHPRTRLNVRAGTVWFDNIDVLARLGGSIEHDPDTAASGYGELGLALELRLQRTLALGLSGLARVYSRDRLAAPRETPEVPEPLPTSRRDLGETSFVEAGVTLRYSLGTRAFRAQFEGYGRSYRRNSTYENLSQEGRANHTGGRFSIEGWAGERLRLRAEYDITSSIDSAPELQSLKSLRLFVEGRF